MPSFYKSFDCFVLPTRGEGFGLPLLEAMACGVPTVGPNWGGNTEFMNDKNSFLVDGNVVPIDNRDFLKLQPQYNGQKWFDINEVQLATTMRGIYDNYSEAKKKADIGAAEIKEKFTWAQTARAINKRLIEIQESLEEKS